MAQTRSDKRRYYYICEKYVFVSKLANSTVGTIYWHHGAVFANVADNNKSKLNEVFVYDILYTFVLCTKILRLMEYHGN